MLARLFFRCSKQQSTTHLLTDVPSYVAIAAAAQALSGLILCLQDRGDHELAQGVVANLRLLTDALNAPLVECEQLVWQEVSDTSEGDSSCKFPVAV